MRYMAPQGIIASLHMGSPPASLLTPHNQNSSVFKQHTMANHSKALEELHRFLSTAWQCILCIEALGPFIDLLVRACPRILAA